MTDRTCTIDGCERAAASRGWCMRHYGRWHRHGDPLAGGPEQERDPEAKRRFIREVAARTGSESDPCIDGWRWGHDWKGYPTVRSGGRMRKVSHLVLEQAGRPRPVPPLDQSLHSCDNPPCIAPYHLRWGTNTENVADMMERGRAARGERIGLAKLTEANVREMRARHIPGRSGNTVALSVEFGVSSRTVHDIVTGRAWAHVT